MGFKKFWLYALLVLLTFVFFLELSWRLNDAEDLVVDSPNGEYQMVIRPVRTFGMFRQGTHVGDDIFLKPKLVLLSGIGFVRVFRGYCPIKAQWKSNEELLVSCPKPEGVPAMSLFSWFVKIYYHEPPFSP